MLCVHVETLVYWLDVSNSSSCPPLTSQSEDVQQHSGGACFLCQSVSVGLSQCVGAAFDLLQTSE